MKQKKNKRFAGFGKHLSVVAMGIVYILAPVLLFVVQTQPAHAASTGVFIDRTSIKVGEQSIYADSNPFDDSYEYVFKTSGGCENKIKFGSASDMQAGNGTQTTQSKSNQKCETSGTNSIKISSTSRRNIFAYKVDDKTIWMPQAADHHHFNVGKAWGPHTFRREKTSDDMFFLVEDDGTPNKYSDGGVRLRDFNSNSFVYQIQDGNCFTGCTSEKDAQGDSLDHRLMFIVEAPDANVYPNAPKAGDKTAGNDDLSDTGDKCYDGGTVLFGILPKNPLKWIVCGISQLLADAIDGINNAIESLLVFNPTNTSGGTSPLKEVWSRVLNIANILFVIAFLVMIISTALDLGIFSNYTVKKLLPRIIIAAILANLSWGICSTLIQIINVIGGAVSAIILSPLGIEPGKTQLALGTAASASGAGIFQTAVVAGLGTLIYFSIASAGAILLPVLAVAFTAAAVALAALLLRRIAIILLIIAAPLAFALWALPGGEKWAQRWWKLFSEMLLMYPIIMALFAAGVFVSQIMPKIDDGPGGSGLGIMTAAVSAVALVLPYFLIPAVFKMASGALSNITGMINDRGKGLVDRSKRWRDEGSQWGRDKKTKAAVKDMRGQLKQLKRAEADYLGMDNKAGEWMQRRRKSRIVGRNWAQGGDAKEVQRSVLAKMEAAHSKENYESASYLARSAGGGIEAKRRDGGSKQFRVIRAGDTEDQAMWLSKDAAVAEAWMGARVEAFEDEYDANGKFTGYSKTKKQGTLFDGSRSSQRVAGSIAGAQGLTPVIDAVQYGDTGANGWKVYNQQGQEIGTHITTSMSEQFRTSGGKDEVRDAASAAYGVLAEVKETHAQTLSGKMPSMVKGASLAFQGIQAGALAGFHENEVTRLMDYTSTEISGVTQSDTWARIGQSVQQIVEEPEKYNMGPKSLLRLKTEYDKYVAGYTVTNPDGTTRAVGGTIPNPVLDKYISAIKSDGTIERVTAPKRII